VLKRSGKEEERMPEVEVKSLESPEETRPFVDKGRADVVHVAGRPVGRGVFEPGWRWSEHVKPIAETDSCQVSHLGYVMSGRMHIAMDDGTEVDVGPGDAVAIPPGHDAWTVGDEPCVLMDFGEIEEYAKAR
jgi:hypothetical protein